MFNFVQLLVGLFCGVQCIPNNDISNITLKFVNQLYNYSVINHTSEYLQNIDPNNRGIECGYVFKMNSTYHLIVTELLSPACQPSELYWCNTNIAHWISYENNPYQWIRNDTVIKGTGNCTEPPNVNHNDVYWAPYMSVFNNTYYTTFVAYDIPCNDYPQNGNIYLSKSNTMYGNYSIISTIMDGNNSQSWEGSKDVVDSFSNPYYITQETANRLNATRLWAFYGSCCNMNASIPDYKWGVGLVYSESNTINGPWIRYPNNPINFTGGVENPVVTITSEGYYIVMYCVNLQELYGCGFSWSLDGINWSDTQIIPAGNVPYCRVPLGLIEQDNGTFTLFYTDFDERHNGDISVWEGYEGMYIANFELIVT